jgi:hypothetical protein
MATTNNLFTQGNTVTNVGGYALDATIASTNTKIDALNNTVFLKTLNKNTSSIDISGQTVLVSGGDISIENIEDIPLITGFALETTLGTTNDKLDTLNTTLTNKVLDKTTSSVDISGQTVAISNTSFDSSNILDTPLITGFALETTLGTTNDKLDTLNTTLTNKVLDKTTSSVDISGQTVAISNTAFECSNIASTPLITGFALEATLDTTNDKLDTLNTTVSNKHLDKTTDSVDITNQNINVNQTLEDSSYDLVAQGSTLWADSLPTPNPFVADLLGREGWWYSNQANVANKSNIYWYANPPTGDPSGFQENDMTFSQLSSMYCVITCDYVDNGSLTIPTMGIFSQPTGTNDIIPTFAHSRWVYQLSSANLAKLRKGETILIYTGATRPNVFNQLPAYPLVQVSVIGEAQPTEIIGYMSINTQATTSIIAYLLQYVGYLNSAVGHIKQYGFKNSKQRLAQENLASLTVTDGVLNVSSSGGGGGTSVVQGISTNTGVAVDINASPSGENINRLLVSSILDDGTNTLSINNDGSLSTLSQVIATDADNAESTIQIFGKNNRLYTTTEITQGGNTLIVNEDGSINVSGGGGVGGNVTVDNIADTPLITGFALETGGNLASIKTNSDKNKYNGDNLKVEIPTTTTLGANTRDGSGTSITSTLVSSKRGLDCNIINASIPVTSTTLATQSTLSSLNNKFSLDNVYTTSIKTVVDGDVVVSPIVEKPDYDVVLNASLYGASEGDNNPPFVANPSGSKGWSYVNTSAVKQSSVRFYSNIPAQGDTVQSNIDVFNQISFFYAVIALDYIGTRDLTNLPYLTLATQATGVDDYIPNVANTIYKYTLPASPFNLIRGEEILIYWTENPGQNIPPVSLMPNLRRFRLDANGTFGPSPGGNPMLAYLSIDTGLGLTEKQQYRLLGAGYKFTATGGQTADILNYTSVDSTFSVKTTIESNLSKLTFNEDNELIVATAGSSSVIQGISTNGGSPINISAIPMGMDVNRLLTNAEITQGGNTLIVNNDGSINVAGSVSDGKAYLYSGDEATSITATTVSSKNGIDANIINVSLDTHCYGSSDGTTFHHLKTNSTGVLSVNSTTQDDNGVGITSTLNGAKQSLDVNVSNTVATNSTVVNGANTLTVNSDGSINVVSSGGSTYGAINNIHSGNLATATFSTALNINNNYGNESVISYRDTSTSSGFITIWGAFDNTNDASYFYIGVLQPVIIRTGNRYASAVLKLKGLKYIRIYNEHTSQVPGVSCSLFSG